MRVVIGGYIPEEGRVSILRTAHSIARHCTRHLATGDQVQLLDPRGADHVQAPRASKRLKLEKRLFGPARLALQRADVLHIIDNDHAFGIPPWNFRRTVVTCHDLMPFLLDPTLRTVYGSRIGRALYRRTVQNMAKCAHVVCVSEFTRQKLLTLSGAHPDRTSVIPQAVEDHFRPVDENDTARQNFMEARGLSGKHVILHVGSCLAYKNIPVLLETFRRLQAESTRETVLLKVGGEFSPADQEFIDRHGLRPQLRHCTALGEQELVLAYNAADLLLWPSRFEGFGLPVLEAMACGTPVVCSNGGSLPEVAGDAACIHDPDDADAMEASCRAILGDPELARKMAEGGIAHARPFTWDRAARAYCGVYKAVAGGG